MATVTLYRKPLFKKFSLPLWVFVNGQPIGLMRKESATLTIPEGSYNLSVKLLFQIWKWRLGIGGDNLITVAEDVPTHIEITDKERLWNILFDIDLVVWLASLFFTLPYPWNIVYHILSDGFFLIWIIRIILIRNRYFLLKVS